MKRIRKHKWKLLILAILGLVLIRANYSYISYSTQELIFESSDDISTYEYALFLGTPKHLTDGSVNNYYKNRIKSAVELYTKGKVHKIIISADSLNKYQENEVELIKSDLIEKGIDGSNLILDNNGNRTWKSIRNLEANVVMDEIILISQKFHLERALYITENKNIKAIGFQAKGEMSNQLMVREILARVKMQLDLMINK